MTLQSIGPKLYCSESSHRMMGAVFPTRMTVIDTDDGLVLVSPVPIDDDLAAELAALGPVHAVVAPNGFHDANFAATVQRYPKARRFGAPGIAKAHPTLEVETLGVESPWAGVSLQFIAGAPKASEVVLIHHESGSVVVTDLVFHILEAQGFMSRLMFKYVAKTLGRLDQSRYWRSLTKDRAAAKASVEQLLEHECTQLVMGHGMIVNTDAHDQLREALRWMLSA